MIIAESSKDVNPARELLKNFPFHQLDFTKEKTRDFFDRYLSLVSALGQIAFASLYEVVRELS